MVDATSADIKDTIKAEVARYFRTSRLPNKPTKDDLLFIHDNQTMLAYLHSSNEQTPKSKIEINIKLNQTGLITY